MDRQTELRRAAALLTQRADEPLSKEQIVRAAVASIDPEVLAELYEIVKDAADEVEHQRERAWGTGWDES
jgi:hypothetical protein